MATPKTTKTETAPVKDAVPAAETAIAETAIADPEIQEPTSDILEQLKTDYLQIWEKSKTFPPFTKEGREINLQLAAQETKINAEKVAIKTKLEQAAKQEQEAARVKLLDDAINTAVSNAVYYEMEFKNFDDAAKAANMDKFNAMTDAAKAAREIVLNELLLKFGGARKVAGTGTGNKNAANPNGTKSQIREIHIANVANGMDDTQSTKALKSLVDASGERLFADSTIWHAINDYRNSLKTV